MRAPKILANVDKVEKCGLQPLTVKQVGGAGSRLDIMPRSLPVRCLLPLTVKQAGGASKWKGSLAG